MSPQMLILPISSPNKCQLFGDCSKITEHPAWWTMVACIKIAAKAELTFEFTTTVGRKLGLANLDII